MLVAQLDFADPEFPVSLVEKPEPTLPGPGYNPLLEAVQKSAFFFAPLRLAGESQVLEMGVRLAVGHRSP